MSSKLNCSVFSKLYHYYFQKLLGKLWLVAFYLLIFILYSFLLPNNNNDSSDFLLPFSSSEWGKTFQSFWVVSLKQLGLLYTVIAPLINEIVGNYKGGGIFSKKKIISKEDIKVVILMPCVNRETIVLAKFAVIFTYFFLINFLVATLPIVFYLFTFTKISTLTIFTFLLTNGLIFALVNFFLLVPMFFWLNESNLLGGVLLLVFIAILGVFGYLFWENLLKLTFLAPTISILFSPLFGLVYYYLYRKIFLTKDLG